MLTPDPRRLAAVTALLLAAQASGAWAVSRPARKAVYDPEIALLAINIQKQSVPLLASELSRQSEWLGFAGVKVLLDHKEAEIVADVEAELSPDADVLESFRRVLVRYHPAEGQAVDQLVDEVRRYHSMPPGPPLVKLAVPKLPGRSPRLLAEAGVGADVERSLAGEQTLQESVAFAERRFGSTGPFLRQRRWNIDFYLGDFRDLLPYYRGIGYRVFYRLRAPYIGYSKQAYVLAPEAGGRGAGGKERAELRPRLVYCGFYGEDYFRHVRAQYGVLARNAGRGPVVRTLYCPDCRWSPPGAKALRDLLATVPYEARIVLMGYDYVFDRPLESLRLGTYENDFWRLKYYDLPAGVAATLESRHTGFGEISALALTEMVRRGAQRLFYAGPAAAVGAGVPPNSLCVPSEFLDQAGRPIKLRNAYPGRTPRSGRHQSVASPLFATSPWLARASGRGVDTVDCEAAPVANAVARINEGRQTPVDLSLVVIASDLANLHPDEDRTIYTLAYETGADREQAKKSYRETVLKFLNTPAPKTSPD